MNNLSLDAATIIRNSFLSKSNSPAPPPPAPPSNKFRTTNTSLFIDVNSGLVQLQAALYGTYETPGRVSDAPSIGYNWGSIGPNASYVDVFSQWLWINGGGDWINSLGASQSLTSPYFTFTANAVSSGNHRYSTNITSGVTAAFNRGKWNSYIVKSTGGTRSLVTQNNPSLAAATIDVIYADTTTATLNCLACIELASGTSYTHIGYPLASNAYNIALEFQMPAQAISSATLNITVDNHTVTATTFNGYLANPTVTTPTVVQGLAAGYTADAGINGNPAVIAGHRYQDGSVLSDWIIPYSTLNVNVFATNSWSPDLFGIGASDNTKLPTAANGVTVAASGKWFYKADTSSTTSLVNSSYSGDNFQPVSPGIGALRIVIPKSNLPDGSAAGYVGSTGSDLWLLFPKSICGNVDETYTRFYVRFAQAPQSLSDAFMYRTSTGADAQYATVGGKWGMGVHQWTQFGGNNQVGGGNLGWTNRQAMLQAAADAPLAGLQPGVHAYDMIGYNFTYGRPYGMGSTLFPNYWYCLEIRCKLNTWAPSGGGASDGIMDIYLDGVLASSWTNWKYRDGPIDYRVTPPKQYGTASGGKTNSAGYSIGATSITLANSGSGNYVANDTINFPGDFNNYQITSGANSIGGGGTITITPGLINAIPAAQTNIGYASVGLPPFGNLGVTGMLLNMYNGGVLPASQDTVIFYSLMACGTSYIGPANI